MSEDRRLIEDYLPLAEISEASAREKSTRKGHISTLHLWWARRPLVASRAAVYAALVPASQFVPNGGTDAQKKSLGRANAAKFLKYLCQYPGSPQGIKEAQQHILAAHANRLSLEQGRPVTVDDIVSGRAPRPRVLDMFAGGGAIPLEAARLGCESFALDLNPVAHVVELCTLVYPQKFGQPEVNAGGMTGQRNGTGASTWGGLAEEVRYWGNWVLEDVSAKIGDVYPLIPDPDTRPSETDANSDANSQHVIGFAEAPHVRLNSSPGLLSPMAYLWSRTVRCKNPVCGATVPLVRQTWLCKRDGRYVALKVIAPKGEKRVRFDVVQATSRSGLGFDPEAFSKGGNATCPFCGTVSDTDYVRKEGRAGRLEQQLMAAVCTQHGSRGKKYVGSDAVAPFVPDESALNERIRLLCSTQGITAPNEPLPPPGTLGFRVQPYGITKWGQLFTTRQTLCLLTFVSAINEAAERISARQTDPERTKAIVSFLALLLDRVAMFGNSLCAWYYQEQAVSGLFSRQALPMLWDFAEVSLFADISGGIAGGLSRVTDAIEPLNFSNPAIVKRGAAQSLLAHVENCDAIITDPPYYDNIPYADLSDFFYVWMKRTLGRFYPEHFATETTPKKNEAIAEPARHNGDKTAAKTSYERMMLASFKEAWRALKPNGALVVVYAHKTTLGWSTLVEALKQADFMVTEAWPVDTEGPGRLRAHDSAALASSIFLVARKRDGALTGSYEEAVRTELEEIIRERVETLWDMGISGADLVIASVGAGLRAFTRFSRVEYANGEEVPAERFLTEVETVVLETILSRLSKEVGGKSGQYSLSSLDTASRFYVLWRYTYSAVELDAGEAIIFANGTHVELDGQNSLTSGNNALVEKRKSKYRLRDYADRGESDKLGLPSESGQPAPLIDILHRMLWLMEKRPTELGAFLSETRPNREQLRLVAQALGGPALKGGQMGDISPTAELSALGRLTANWQSLIEDLALTTGERVERKTGQKQLI